MIFKHYDRVSIFFFIISFEHNQSQPNGEKDKQASADDRLRLLKIRVCIPYATMYKAKYFGRSRDHQQIYCFAADLSVLEIPGM